MHTLNFKRTLAAMIGNVGGMVAFVATGALDGIPHIGTIIALGISMGISLDSVINKGAREPWTQEQRAAKL